MQGEGRGGREWEQVTRMEYAACLKNVRAGFNRGTGEVALLFREIYPVWWAVRQRSARRGPRHMGGKRGSQIMARHMGGGES